MAVMPLLALNVNARRHRVEQGIEVIGAYGQALSGEEIDWIVECGVDALAGRKAGLGLRNQVCGLLQLQEIGTNTGGKDNVTHGRLLAALGQIACRDNEILGLIDG